MWRAMRGLELAPGLSLEITVKSLLLERARLLTPDPRLHLLGERADFQESVCLSLLCLSMQHKKNGRVGARRSNCVEVIMSR